MAGYLCMHTWQSCSLGPPSQACVPSGVSCTCVDVAPCPDSTQLPAVTDVTPALPAPTKSTQLATIVGASVSVLLALAALVVFLRFRSRKRPRVKVDETLERIAKDPVYFLVQQDMMSTYGAPLSHTEIQKLQDLTYFGPGGASSAQNDKRA